MTDAEFIASLRKRPASYRNSLGTLVSVTEAEYNRLGVVQYQYTHTSGFDRNHRYYKREDLDEWLRMCELRIAMNVAKALAP